MDSNTYFDGERQSPAVKDRRAQLELFWCVCCPSECRVTLGFILAVSRTFGAYSRARYFTLPLLRCYLENGCIKFACNPCLMILHPGVNLSNAVAVSTNECI